MLKYIFCFSIGVICVAAQAGWQSGTSYQPYSQYNHTGNRYNPTAQGGSWNYVGNPYARPANGSAVNSGHNFAANNNPQRGGYNATRTPWATSYLNQTRQDSFHPGTTRWQSSYNGSAGFQSGNLQSGHTGPYAITNTTGFAGRFRGNSGLGYGSRNNSFPGQTTGYGGNAGGQIGNSGSWYNPTRANLNSTSFVSGYAPYPSAGNNASQGQGFTGQRTSFGNRNTSSNFGGYGFRANQGNYSQGNPIIY